MRRALLNDENANKKGMVEAKSGELVTHEKRNLCIYITKIGGM